MEKEKVFCENKSRKKYNILSRPKRHVLLNKHQSNLSSDLLRQLENITDDESDDEEFIPTKTKIKKKTNNLKLNKSLNELDDILNDKKVSTTDEAKKDTNAVLNDDDHFKLILNKINDKATIEDALINLNEISIKDNSTSIKSTSDVFLREGNSPIKLTKRFLSKEIRKNSNSFKKSNLKKKRKKKIKFTKTKFESDEETKKMINSFRIKPKIKSVEEVKVKSKHYNNTLLNIDKNINCNVFKLNQGPYVKRIKQNYKTDYNGKKANIELEYEIYNVKQQNESNLLIKKNIGLSSDQKSSSNDLTLAPSKDKPCIISDKNGPWICSLCSLGPNTKIDNLVSGELFGPYQIALNDEFDSGDIIQGFFESRNEILEKDFKQVWLHENCAIWSSNIYTKNNRTFGIKRAIRLGSETKCKLCKKFGATLLCGEKTCTNAYHYYCAAKFECLFDQENFVIYCQTHSF